MELRNLLIALAIFYQGDWKKINRAINTKECPPQDVLESHLKYVKSGVITIVDDNYPNYLKKSPQPPYVLFYYGDISLIYDGNKNVAVVGGRKASEKGKENVYYLVSGICKKYNIVSGLAIGIDSVAHKAALQNGGKTIAVLANGIEYCYPCESEALYQIIREKHLVISEYFGFLSPEREHFHQRNRLIVAFSKGVIVGEATRRSGTGITAQITIQSNKDLIAIPSDELIDSLNNMMIREGCPVALVPEDIFYYLGDKEESLLGEVK